MPQWLRNLVMIVGLGAWLAVIVVTLLQGKLPDAVLLGVPAALVLALSPPKIGGGGGAAPPAETPPPDGATT